jgi:hypothetical protein
VDIGLGRTGLMRCWWVTTTGRRCGLRGRSGRASPRTFAGRCSRSCSRSSLEVSVRGSPTARPLTGVAASRRSRWRRCSGSSRSSWPRFGSWSGRRMGICDTLRFWVSGTIRPCGASVVRYDAEGRCRGTEAAGQFPSRTSREATPGTTPSATSPGLPSRGVRVPRELLERGEILGTLSASRHQLHPDNDTWDDWDTLSTTPDHPPRVLAAERSDLRRTPRRSQRRRAGRPGPVGGDPADCRIKRE